MRLEQTQEKSLLVIVSDRMDRRFFRELYGESPAAHEAVRRLETQLRDAVSLMQDLFGALYKADPVLLPEKEVAASALFHRGILERVMASPRYAELRQMTYLDQGMALQGAVVLVQQVYEMIADNSGAARATQLSNAAGEAQSRQAVAEMAGDQAEATKQAVGVDFFGREIRHLLEQINGDLTDQVRQAAGQTLRHMQQIVKFAEGLGLDEARQELSVEGQLQLFNRLMNNPDLAKMIDLTMACREAARAQLATRSRRPSAEIYSISRGRDLARVLPSELARLAGPAKVDFMRRYAERQLMQYSYRQREPESLPPLLILMDTSSSMEYRVIPYQFRRRDWLSAVALTLMERAEVEGRKCGVVFFGSQEEPGGHRGIAEFLPVAQGGSVGLESRLAAVTTFLGGGSAYQNGLRRIYQEVEKDPELRGADVVILTDGEWEEWVEGPVAELVEGKVKAGLRVLTFLPPWGTTEFAAPISDELFIIDYNEEGLVSVLNALDEEAK